MDREGREERVQDSGIADIPALNDTVADRTFDRLPRHVHIYLTSYSRTYKQGYKQTRERKARQSLGFLSPPEHICSSLIPGVLFNPDIPNITPRFSKVMNR